MKKKYNWLYLIIISLFILYQAPKQSNQAWLSIFWTF
jgi:hypothetical protein